jgi:hypothetical protein
VTLFESVIREIAGWILRPDDDLERPFASGVSESVVGPHHISQGEMMRHELFRLEFSGQNRLQETVG